MNAADVAADVLFARKIQPLFKVKCFTYPHLGRNFRLTDVEGSVVKDILR